MGATFFGDFRRFDESYPPSVWAPPASNVFPTTATPGTPGAFGNPLAPPATLDVPDDLTELQALGALGNVAAWATGEYVTLEDMSEAHWDGNAWAAGQAAAPPPPPADVPDDTWTKAQIVAWLNAHGDPSQDSLTKAELLEHVGNILDDD